MVNLLLQCISGGMDLSAVYCHGLGTTVPLMGNLSALVYNISFLFI